MIVLSFGSLKLLRSHSRLSYLSLALRTAKSELKLLFQTDLFLHASTLCSVLNRCFGHEFWTFVENTTVEHVFFSQVCLIQ